MKELIYNIQQAQQKLNTEAKYLRNHLRRMMGSEFMAPLTDDDGCLIFADHEEAGENILVSEYLGESHDGLQIEGLRPNGQPIFNELPEGYTDSWDDVPADILCRCAVMFDSILQSKYIFGGPQIVISQEIREKIETAVSARYSVSQYGQPMRFGDNSIVSNIHGGVLQVPGLPAEYSVRARTFSPQRQGESQTVAWSLWYNTGPDSEV